MSALAATLAAMAAQTALNQVSANIKNKKSYKYSKKLAKYQNELNIENWNRVNEYNLPVNERQRLRQAGLNPNFSDGSSLGQQIAPVSGTQFQAEQPNLGDSLMQGAQQYQSFKQQQASTELIKQQARGQRLQNDITEQYGSERADLDNKLTIQQIQKAIEEKDYTRAQRLTEDLLRQPRADNLNASTRNLDASTENLQEQTRLAPLYYDLEARKVETLEGTLIEMNRHNIALENLESALNSSIIRKNNADASLIEIQGALENYLWQNGYSAEKYKNEIDLVSETINNYKDEIKHRGISLPEIAGNLLNDLVTSPRNSALYKILKKFSKPNSIMDQILDIYVDAKEGEGITPPIGPDSSGSSKGKSRKKYSVIDKRGKSKPKLNLQRVTAD